MVDLDLAKFFDRVHHQRLLARIAERVKYRRIVALVRLTLKAAVIMPDGTKIAVQEGTPQGGPLSPMLSNIVLNELDDELARRGLRFVRYADDCNIFVRSERAGKRVMASIWGFLETRMRLQVNEEKVVCGHPMRFNSWASAFGAREGRQATKSPSFPPPKQRNDEDENAGDDVSELGTIHHILHGRRQRIPDGVDIAFPALHAGGGPRIWRSRRSCPPPRQGDYCPTEEAPSLPLPTPESQRRQRKGCRQLCVLRQGSMGEIKPPRDAEGLSSVMVRRSDGLAQSDVEGLNPPQVSAQLVLEL